MTETLITLCYYYPPSEMTPNSITGVTKTSYDIVEVTFNYNNSSQTICMTPEAFTNWYAANTALISDSGNSGLLSGWNTTLLTAYTNYNPLSGNVGVFSNANAYLSAYVTSQGLQWIPYNSYQSLGIFQNPSGVYADDQKELYALIQPNASSSIISWFWVEVILVVAFMFALYLIILNFTQGKFKLSAPSIPGGAERKEKRAETRAEQREIKKEQRGEEREKRKEERLAARGAVTSEGRKLTAEQRKAEELQLERAKEQRRRAEFEVKYGAAP